jgi:RNA polymerase sigma factor (sigma-70 family)
MPAVTNLDDTVKHLRKWAAARDADQLADQELVQRYVTSKDQAAFSCLVKRHGPMVLGICRKMLRHEQDAEDAFQATFLVLAKKGSTIRQREAVGGWLYSVAYRVASKLRAVQARRKVRENPLGDQVPARDGEDLSWREVQLAVCAELDRLSEKYRGPLLLCCLQGKTRDEAAQQLGCGVGVLRGRLDRGRELLRARLQRRGLALSAALLSLGVAENASAAFLHASLFSSTVKAATSAGTTASAKIVSAQAAALSQGVIQAMFLGKLKAAVVTVATLVAVSSAAGVVCYRTMAQEPSPSSTPAAQRTSESGKRSGDDVDPRKLQLELERLRLELEKTRLELVRARKEIAILKARAEADRVRAMRQAEEAALRDYLAAQKGAGKTRKIADPKRPDQTTSPDGQRMAAADGNAIDIFDVRTGKQLARGLGHTGTVTALAFSPDGKIIASGSKDKSVVLWDSASFRELRKFSLPSPVSSVRFSADGRNLIVGESDQTQRQFDIATGKELSNNRNGEQ